MSLVVPSLRGIVASAPWAKNELWRKAQAVPSLDLRFADSKSLTDAVSGQNLITFTRASSGTYVGSDGLIKTALADVPRFDHNPVTGESLGLLIEEQRTNSIRNNTMVGAVAGTPGTLPTNWSATAPANGITREIVGTGTEDGISYIDVRFFGTNTLGSIFYMDIDFDGETIPAAQSQVWTESCYVKLVAGVITGAAFSSIPRLIIYEVPGFASSILLLSSLTSDALVKQRFSLSRTLANAATTAVSSRLSFTIAVGGTIDFTLRIGLPQLEQGAFATSVIPTAGATVTRNADVATITGSNFSSWYRQDEGTVFAETQLQSTVARNAAGFDLNDNSTNNRLIFRAFTTGSADQFVFRSGGSTVALISSAGSSPSLDRRRSIAVIKADDFAATSDGLLPVSDNSGAVPVGVSQILIGSSQGGSEILGGHISRLAFFDRRLPDATLQAITSP